MSPMPQSDKAGDDTARARPAARGRAQRLQSIGEEPDPRFSLANERTFLAWIRTAVALMVAGLAVAEFFSSRSQATRLVIAIPLVLLGAVVAFTSFPRWEEKERAMRLGEPLPPSSLPRLLAVAVGIVAVVAAVLAVIDS
jgi:putative membrane protein